MTPEERKADQDRKAARQATLDKFPDGEAVIDDDDIRHLTGDEILALANAGRLKHMNIGPDRHPGRLRRWR